MKNFIPAILVLLACFTLSAQGNFSLYRNNGNNLETNFYKKLSTNIKLDRSNYDGSPFMDDELQLGTIVLNGKDEQSFFMRYNILHQRIEFSEVNDVETLKMLPKDEKLIVRLNGKLLQYLNLPNMPATYYEIVKVFDENTLLLVNHDKDVVLPQQKNSYVAETQKARIKSSSTIYFTSDEFSTELDNHKKRSVKAFPKSDQSILKEYIKENKIKFKDDYKGLIALVGKYLDLKS
ncbi:hypothetical protein A9Q93_08410 [Nonlabens dokdonensis]|jgi:hypothetical protein|uniref:Secreted protein n=1 Tax=Nonlabens dokdonensis TaxID=328515 RepID=A0A1Z8AV60_9FLAO|nr:hypothetical protein [Nonlabens dokdonensis]OUS14220.1 hypothetical protein A9Q93_08410 [Nonlabens dokdonensis]